MAGFQTQGYWLVGAGEWAQNRAPASGGNFPAASVILLKPSISREMKYLFQTHFLPSNIYIFIDLCAHICVCISVCVCVCGICAFVKWLAHQHSLDEMLLKLIVSELLTDSWEVLQGGRGATL